MTGKLSKNFHGVAIGPLSNILAVKGHFLSVAKGLDVEAEIQILKVI